MHYDVMDYDVIDNHENKIQYSSKRKCRICSMYLELRK